jgi:WD40 repeat protein
MGNLTDQSPTPRLIIPVDVEVQNYIFSPDGTQIAAAQLDFQDREQAAVRVWDTVTGELLLTIEDYGSVQFSPDGGNLLIGDTTSKRLWNLETGALVLEMPYGAVLDNNWSRAAYWDWGRGNLRVVDVGTGSVTTLPLIPDYQGTILALSSASAHVVYKDGNLQVYDLVDGNFSFEIPQFAAQRVNFSADGQHVAVEDSFVNAAGDWRPIMRLYESGTLIAEWENTPQMGFALFHPNERMIALRGNYGRFSMSPEVQEELRSFDGQLLAQWTIPEPFTSHHIFSPDGRFLATGGGYGGLRVWDVAATIEGMNDPSDTNYGGIPIGGVFWNSFAEFNAVVFSSDSAMIAVEAFFRQEFSLETEHHVYVFSVSDFTGDFQLLSEMNPAILPHTSVPQFSPSGEFIMARLTRERGFGLWDVQTLNQIAHFDSAFLATFNPDGQLVAIYGDGEIHIWQVSDLLMADSEPLIVFPSELSLSELGFNGDGSLLIGRSQNKIFVWGTDAL